ncbi:fibronectin type III domain-containing protein [Candidatus Poriferisodalis sp.]|uniref:fibronectin type III domain-containing protein n=1 Tax=Candidatus Poriferisodalis sp. TaxID=3101277 RepID=UPI003AF8AE89
MKRRSRTAPDDLTEPSMVGHKATRMRVTAVLCVVVLCVATLVVATPTQVHAQSDPLTEEETDYVTGAPTCCMYMWGDTWIWLTWVNASSHDKHGNEITYAEVRYIREDVEDKSDENWTVVRAETDWQHEVTGLEFEVVYRYQIRAGSVAGVSPWSDSLIEGARTRPSPIYQPSLTVGDGSLVVSWAQLPDSDDIDYVGYEVYWTRTDTPLKYRTWAWPTSGFISSPDECHASERMSYIITGLDNGHSYDVLVRAKSSWGDWSTPFLEYEQSSSATPYASAGTPEPIAAFASCDLPPPVMSRQSVSLYLNPAFLRTGDDPVPDSSPSEDVAPNPDSTPDPDPDSGSDPNPDPDADPDEEQPLTAEFVADTVPRAHTGSGKFTVRIQFSEAIRVSYKTLRDNLLAVTNGAVRKFKRVDGRSDLWEIHIRPNSTADVTLTLPAATDCTKTGKSYTQACTADGTPLSHDVTLTIPGPSSGSASVGTASVRRWG